MDYKARFYDAALGRWTQPDSMVPNPADPQSFNRYAFVLNNPARYSDPSGYDYCDHINPRNQEDCDAGEWRIASRLHRDAKDLTPKGLIGLYRRYYGSRAGVGGLGDPANRANSLLSGEIEAYMRTHPNYSVADDDMSLDDFGLFWGIREQYWRDRCMASNGACLALGNNDVQNLMYYYDFHQTMTTTVFDPTRIDWTLTGLDSASFMFSVVGLNAAPQSVEALYVNVAARTTGIASGTYSYISGDRTGAWLSGGSFAPPPIGTIFSGASVVRDISAGFYQVPYFPPISR